MTIQQKEQALADYLKIDIDDIQSQGKSLFLVNADEYIVLSPNEEFKLAVDSCIQYYEDNGIEEDAIRDLIDTNFINPNYFREIQEDFYNDLIEDMAYEGDNQFGVRLYREMYYAHILKASDFKPSINANNKNQEHKIKLTDNQIDYKYEEFLDYLCQTPPIQWYINQYNIDSFEDLINNNLFEKGIIDLKGFAETEVELYGPDYWIPHDRRYEKEDFIIYKI